MTCVLLILAAMSTALLIAATLRLTSLVSTVLAAYVAFVGNLTLATLVLSPFREVTRGGLAVVEAVLVTGAAAGWWLRGRPGLALGSARRTFGYLIRDPVTALFLGVALAALLYELIVAFTAPANNYDSLTYHLARAAAWAQHGGYYWVPNAPTDRINEFQPLAEQQQLFLIVASGGGALFALPQYLAELAILVGVFGTARRLGFEARAAACSAFLLASFSLVALESTTAQNDLVAASFPIVATCFLLGGGGIEAALAGASVGIGLGSKLTTALVLPVLIALALARGRRVFVPAVAGAVAGFAAIGMWGYVLNGIHSGNVLGNGSARVEGMASPAYPGSILTALDVLYQTMDISVLSHRLIDVLAAAGLAAAVAAVAAALIARRAGLRAAFAEGTRVALPFLAPLLAIAGGGVIAYLTRAWGHPVRGVYGLIGGLNRTSNEDTSAFGPIGAVLLFAVPGLTIGAYARRRVDARHLFLALAFPGYLILLVCQAKWNLFLNRFLLVPVVLVAPLFARLFRSRATTAAYLVVAALMVAVTLAHDVTKPFESRFGRPWQLTRAQSLEVAGDPQIAAAITSYARLVPPRACVGAVLGEDEPSYLLWGPKLEHQVIFLSSNGNPVTAALRAGLFYVVVSTGRNRPVAARFRAAGWKIRSLGGYWLLASEPRAASARCIDL